MDCPSGFQAKWQAEYPNRKGVQYWWDYDERVNKSLEGARGNDEILRFVWAWPGGNCSEYEADPKRLVVANVGTKFARRLRRIFVQASPSVDCDMGDENTPSEPEFQIVQWEPDFLSDEKVTWQVAYEFNRVEYWWDYNAHVSQGLDNSLKLGELLGFNWDWGILKRGEISEYVADPVHGVVTNQKTQHARKIRRMLMP